MRSALRAVIAGDASEKNVLGLNARNRLVVYRQNQRKHYPLANDKIIAKRLLTLAGIPVPKTICHFETIHEARQIEDHLGEVRSFVLKPARGRGGEGIVILKDRSRRGWLDGSGREWTKRALGRHIGNILFGNYANGLIDRALAEEKIEPAKLIGTVSFLGLPDVRMITQQGEPVMAMLRIPTMRSGGRANLHQGAVGVGVDLAEGKTTGAIYQGRPIRRHPDTEDDLLGHNVARWLEILELSRRVAAVVPLGYMGLDIVLDVSRGPLVLEINARPGLEIQNANRQGLRRILNLDESEGDLR